MLITRSSSRLVDIYMLRCLLPASISWYTKALEGFPIFSLPSFPPSTRPLAFARQIALANEFQVPFLLSCATYLPLHLCSLLCDKEAVLLPIIEDHTYTFFTCGSAGIVIVSFPISFRTNVTNSLYKAYEQRKPC